MSLLSGIAEGLMAAGQTVGQGFFAQAQMLSDTERERIRQASIEKRWAKEDARMAKQDERTATMDQRNENRYQEGKVTGEERYQEGLTRQTQESSRRDVRETRAGEKQDAMMLGQSLDRLDKLKNDKAKEIAEAFKDPMSGGITDQAGYSQAMNDLNMSYRQDAQQIVERSGLAPEQVNRYGFGMYLPEDAPKVETPSPEVSQPEAVAPGFDLADWAKGARTTPGATMSQPGTDEMTPDQMRQLTPEQQFQRIEDVKAMRIKDQGNKKTGLMGVDWEKTGGQIKSVW